MATHPALPLVHDESVRHPASDRASRLPGADPDTGPDASPAASPAGRRDEKVGGDELDRIALDATEMSALRRWGRALAALAKVMVDPERTDQVLVFSIHANAGSMRRRVARFFDDAEARRLYEEHRTIDSRSIDLDALAALPADTLGHAYATFLRSRGLTPAVFDGPPAQVSDPRMQYVVQRLRQTHDLWHVVTGHDTDAPSEIALQAFTFAQVRAPSAGILAALGTLRALRHRPSMPRDTLASFRVGRAARRLATFPWEDHWSTPLREVRRMLDLPVDGVRLR